MVKADATGMSLYEYSAELVYVVDGDTVDLMVDLGFRIKVRDRFRLLRINTPERGQPGYAEAKAYVQRVQEMAPHLQVRTHFDGADKYGRMLAEVYYVDWRAPNIGRTVCLNDELLTIGLAVPYAK